MLELDNSNEAIKMRMLKHALNYWNIKSSNDLDPVVKLILEALSTELHNLGNEIKDVQVRILEKVAGLIAPDFLTCPNPAHAVMHALPVEPTEILYNTTSFVTQKKISSKQDEVLDSTMDVFFTPVDSVQIFDAQVMYIATAEKLFAYNQSFNKQLVTRSKSRQLERQYLWLGLKLNPQIENINNLFFYFDWRNVEPKSVSRIYQLLPLTKWFINENEIETETGLKYAKNNNIVDAYDSVFSEYDQVTLLEKDTKHFYDHKFVTITKQKLNTSLKDQLAIYPASFQNNFSDNDLQKLNEKLLWIKVDFPSTMQFEFFDEVQVYTNAFPVMNRQLNDLKFRLKGGSNIIPLKTDVFDQFLSIYSLDDDTHNYKAIPHKKKEEEVYGTYTLRNGGVERFDTRNARELISYLLELLRSESAAFSSYGYDFMATTLKEMNQKISLMEQKTKSYSNNAGEISNYIIVKPFEGFDMMYVKYWTTLAEAANYIRINTRLQLTRGLKVKADSLIFLTTTTGGKNKLNSQEKLQAFRYGIMTRNRIITKEDIRNFCFYDLGDKISEVKIEKGFELSVLPHEAFRKTINIILTPSENDDLPGEAWNMLSEQLKSRLELRSGTSSSYKIIVKHY